MEVGEEIQPRKRSRVSNGTTVASKDEDEADGKKHVAVGVGGHVRSSWPQHASSRIYRVSRASGGKDRHSKVLTAKGLRDRRVRLSVPTAIQFYDLQDRLRYDHPSKAVEWLIKAASTAIAELPPLDGPFPDPNLLSTKPTTPPDVAGDNQNHLSLTKSGCSSNSDTSKGSVLSLSRSDMRTKARERARERTTAGKVVEKEDHISPPTLNSPNSFTELLTGGGANNNTTCSATVDHQSPICKATTDYFLGQLQKFQHQHQQPFLSQPSHYGSTPTMVPFSMGEHHPELQQISFLAQDHFAPVTAVAPPGDLNFSISSGTAGLNNRGTLQSNSAMQYPHHLQKLSSPVDNVSNLSFFFGPAAPVAGATSSENQFSAAAAAGFDARLQLYYTDGYRHSDIKGKGKN